MVRRLGEFLFGGSGSLLLLLTCLLPGLAPAVAWGELAIKKIEVNQALGNQHLGHLHFVAGKSTVVRAFLSESVTFSKRLKLLGLENTKATATNTTTKKSFELKPKTYTAATDVVDFYCPKVSECGNWADGNYTFEVTVKGVTQTTAESHAFKKRNPLRMLAVPVKANYRGEAVSYDREFAALWKYTRDVYPVADNGIKWKIRGQLDASANEFDLTTDEGQDKLLVALNGLNSSRCGKEDEQLGDNCSDIIVGIIPRQPSIGAGYTRGKPSVVVTGTDHDANATVAHETAHCFDVGDTYEGGYFNCKINKAPSEWVGKDWDKPKQKSRCLNGPQPYEEIGAKIPATAHAYEVNDRGKLGVMADFMGREADPAILWITPDVYDHLFKSFAPPVASKLLSDAAPQRLIAFKGFITEADNEITLDPWESYTGSVAIPDSNGTFIIKALDGDGKVLATRGIEVSFWVRSDPPRHVKSAPFSGTMRFPEGTSRFEMVRASDGKVLAEINVSVSPPVVAEVSPTTPGMVISGEYTITWTGQDADGNGLAYKVEYNPDPSNPQSPWLILMADLTETQLIGDFDQLPGGTDATIRVTATDGILTASALSAAFTVAVKSPLVFIDELEWGQDYEYGAAILLEGEAYDFNNGWLANDNLEWKSDLTGVLGNGSPLLVDSLTPGEHTITLTATNSAGFQSSDQTKITVSECTFDVTPENLTFKPDGGSIAIQVTASQPEGTVGVCSLTDDDLSTWTYDDDSWIEAKVSSFKENQGVVTVALEVNDSKYARRGVVGILGTAVEVIQKGAACSLRLGEVVQTFEQEGGTGTIQVDVINGCDLKWWASQDRTWLTITSGQSGKGDGTVTFSVASNPKKIRRIGHIGVNNRSFTVIQYPGLDHPTGKPAP